MKVQESKEDGLYYPILMAMGYVGSHLMEHGLMVISIWIYLVHLLQRYITFSDGELVYRDPSGGLSILMLETTTVKILMTNATFVSYYKKFPLIGRLRF